jgi:L-asparaginase II
MLAEVAAAVELDPASIPTAADGCGVVTFALTLECSARLFGTLPRLDGGSRVVAAMRAHPELLRGPVAADAMTIRLLDGWAAKGGAEGLFCACSPEGLGVALKVSDGAFRAIRPALAEFLARLGFDPGVLAESPVENSRGEVVGQVVTTGT